MAAIPGTYLTLTPVKIGAASDNLLVILNVLAGIVDRELDGSFSSFKISLPVFVTTVVTLRSWTVSTDSGPARLVNRDLRMFSDWSLPVTLSDILLVPLTAIADAIRASKTERTLVDILSLEPAWGGHRRYIAITTTDTGSGTMCSLSSDRARSRVPTRTRRQVNLCEWESNSLDQRYAYREWSKPIKKKAFLLSAILAPSGRNQPKRRNPRTIQGKKNLLY